MPSSTGAFFADSRRAWLGICPDSRLFPGRWRNVDRQDRGCDEAPRYQRHRSSRHTLKTEARQFGADPLGALAEEIEFAARRAIEARMFPDELIPTVTRLRPLYLETMELFEKETNPLVSRRPALRARRHGDH
jgi:hypothetical protein